jgi:hypothetical protein
MSKPKPFHPIEHRLLRQVLYATFESASFGSVVSPWLVIENSTEVQAGLAAMEYNGPRVVEPYGYLKLSVAGVSSCLMQRVDAFKPT